MSRPVALAALVLAAGAAACAPTPRPEPASRGAAPAAAELRSQAWPEADRLFRSDAHWLGGDAALSVPLGADRVLWLFGDSFVDELGRGSRRSARMIRNSIAVQQGLDPSAARLQFHYRHDDAGLPEAFFPAPERGFYWPGHGIVLDGALTLFLSRVRSAPGTPLGFESAGFAVVRVDDPRAPPAAWRPRPLALPAVAADEVIGAAVLEHGGYVYAARIREPGDQSLSLVRWPRQAFAAGELSDMQRWDGTRFGPGPSVPVALHVGTELSISADPGGGFLMVHSGDFGPSPLLFRRASALTGPWSEPRVLYRPDEMARQDVLVYAAKAHPELEGAPLVATYATNTLDADTLLDDDSLYFPRFVRVWAPIGPP